MLLLVLGLLVLVTIHLVPTFSSVRESLLNRLGDAVYKAIFAAIALLGLILIIVGKSRAEFVSLWQPPVWGRHVAPVLMLIAFILLPAAYLPSNVKRFTRHPMLWGITFWSIGHLLANGDLASLLLFGGLGVFALFAMWSANLRGATRSTTKYPLTKDAIVVVAGVVVYGGFLFLHPYLFGVPVIS